MNPIATVVSVQGVVWAQAQDGSVRQLNAGDQVLASEVLISTAGSQIVLDFGDGSPVTLTGEQVMQMADSIRANVSVDPDESQLSAETVEILERLMGPLPEGSTFVRTDGTEGEIEGQGFGFVELGRIGEALEADGINPLRLLRIEEPYRDASIAPVAVAPTSSHGTGNLEDGTLYAQGNNHTGYPGSLTPPPAALPPSGVITVNVPDIDASNQSNVLVTGTVENILPGTIVDITITDKNGNTVTTTAVVRDDLTFQVPVDLTELEDGDLTTDVTVIDQRNDPISATDTSTKDTVPGTLQVNFENVDNEANLVDISGSTSDVAPGSEVNLIITDGAGGSVTVTVIVDDSGNYRADNVDITGFEYGTLRVDATTVDTKTNILTDDDQILFVAPPGDITVSIDDIDPSGSMDLSGTTKHVPPDSVIDIVITDKNGNKIELNTTVDENGNYNVPGIDVGELVDGPIEVVAKTEDVGDKEITAKDNTTLDIVPGAITVDIPNVDENNVTAVKITGTTKDVPPGSSVTLRISDEDGTTLTRTVTVDEDGNYELTVDLSRLTDGQITVDASSRDNNDNPVTARDQTDKVIPEPEPEPEPEPQPEGFIVVDIPSLIPANATSVQVTGSTYDVPAGAIVSITISDSRGSSVTVNATVGSDGTYQTTANLSGMQSGSVSASATVTDNYGQSIWGHDSGIIDTAPIIPPGSLSVQFDNVDSVAATADISGTTNRVAPGQTVTLRLNDQYNTVQTYTTVVQADGSFSVSGVDVSMLADGQIRVVARATAMNGGSVTDNDTDVLDSMASNITVNMTDANGDNQTAVPINGTTADVGPGQTVTLDITDGNNTITVTATVQPDGTYSTTADVSTLDNGPLTVTARTTDNNGNPIQGTDTATKNDLAGAIYVEFENVDAAGLTVDLKGHTVSVNAGEVVTLVITDQAGGSYTVPGPVTVQADGTYAVNGVDISSLIDGPLTVTATATDAAGFNVNATDNTTLDGRMGAITVEITDVDNTAGTINISGTTEDVYDWPNNDEVTLVITDQTGKSITETTTVDASGNYSLNGIDVTGLTDGPITVVASATDNNGNPVDATDNDELDYLPGQVTVDIIDVTDVNQGAVPVKGTTVDVPVGSIIELVITDNAGGEVRTTATVGSNGNYLITTDLSALQNGPLTVTAETVDHNGNIVTGNDNSLKSSSAETIVVQFDSVNDTAQTVNISGNVVGVAPGTDVELVLSDSEGNVLPVITVQVDATGAYSAANVDVAGLVDGPITVVAETVNSNGFPISDTDQTELDAVQGDLTIGTVTVHDGGPTIDISGTTTDVTPGSTVTIIIKDGEGNEVEVTTTTDGNGDYDLPNIDIKNLVDGPLTIEASTTDRNGNPVDDNKTDVLDHTPGAITVILPNVNSGNETEVPIRGTTTDVAPGDTVTLVITDQFNNDVTVTATVNGDGTYLVLVDLSTLEDGPLDVIATATDRNGDPVDATDTSIKDAVAGNITVQVDGVDDTAGTIDISGDTVNVDASEPVTLTITDQDGNVVTVPDPVLVQADGSYAITGVDVSSLTDGPLTIDASTVDLNGNPVDAQTTAVLDHKDGSLTIKDVTVDNAGPTLDIDGGTTDVPPGAEVVITITDQEGNVVTVPGPVTVQPDGSYEVTGVDISTLVDGPLTIEANTTDNNGSPVGDTETGVLDHTPGAITVDLPDVNSGNEKAVPINGTTADVPAGATVTLEITDGTDTVTVTAPVGTDGSYSTSADLSSLKNGPIDVTATSTDNNGNTVTGIDGAMKNAVAGSIEVEVDSVDDIAGTLDISGTTSNVNVGEVVTLTITDQYNNATSTTVTVAVGGTYVVTGVDVSMLSDGPLTVLAEATDLSGNAVEDTTTAILDQESGDLTIDNVTVDNAGPTLDIDGGTTDVPPNSTVTITITDGDGNTVVVTTTTDNNGNYDLPNIDISTLVDGPLTIEATTTDNNGDPVGDNATSTLNHTPGAITVEMPNVNDGNETQVPISGTTTDVAPGETVNLIITDQFGNDLPATATVNADGSYLVLVDLSTLEDGPLGVVATATDRNGGPVDAIDTSIKDAVAGNITVQVDGVDDTTGTLDISGATVNVDASEPVTLTITDQDGNVVTVTDPVLVQADGSYAITGVDVSSLTDGPLTIDASTVDLNGNPVDAQTTAVLDHLDGDLTIDNVIVDNAGPTVNIDGGTTDVPPGAEVVITITDQEGNVVTVPGPVTVQPDGSYEVTGVDISTLVDGPLTVEASTTDNNGNPVSDNGIATLDHIPGTITVELPDVNSGNEKAVPINGTTADVPAGATVTLEITDGTDTVTVTALVGTDGSYSTSADLSSLKNGPIDVTATSTDNNGNTVTGIDGAMKNAVAGSIEVEVDSVDDIAGTLDISGTTSNVNVGEVVTLTITDQYNNTTSTTATVAVGGTYVVTGVDVSMLTDGPLTVLAETTDLSGNLIDDTAITALDHVQGDLTIDNVTVDDNGPTMNIDGGTTDVPPNSTVTITITDGDGNTVVVTTTTDNNGDYNLPNIDISTLVDGPLIIEATTTDNNGDPVGDNATSTLDHTPGTITVEMPNVNDGNETQVPISGTTTDVAPGETVTLVITDQFNADVTATATVNVDGSYLVLVDLSALADGDLEVDASATDRNGDSVTATDASIKDAVAGDIIVQVDNVDDAVGTMDISGTTVNVNAGALVALVITDQNGASVIVAPADVVVQADGTYTITNINIRGLTDGPLTITAETVDLNGNTVDDQTTAVRDYVPGDLDIDNVIVDSAGPTVDIEGGTTDVPPGAEVVITITDQEGNTITVPGPVTVQPGGSYEVTGVDISTLVDGPLIIEASTTDNNGNPVSDTGTATLDHTPGAITVEMPNVNDGNETEVPIRGTTTDVQPGETVTLVITDQFNASVTATATVNADGTYLVLVDLSGLADGDLEVDASATDRNGDQVDATDTSIKDAVAGNITVQVDHVDDPAGTIDISGTTVNVNAGALVALVITDQNGASVIVAPADVVVQADGSYAITGVDVSSLTDGPLTIDASTVDLNGNPVDAQTTGVLDHVDGDLIIDNVIVDNAGPTVSIDGGTTDVPPGAEVVITITDQEGNVVTVPGPVTVQSDGSYEVTGVDISTLVDGPLIIEASTTDNNGKPVGATDTGVLDHTPGTITVELPDVNSGNEKAVPISGTTTDVPVGSTVILEITDGTTTVPVTALVQSDGSYSATADLSGLNNGSISVEATSTDNNGQLVDDTDTAMKNAVAGSIEVEVDSVDDIAGTLDISGTTSNVNVGEVVTLTITDQYNNTASTTATVAVGGTYVVTGVDVSMLTDGPLTVLAETTDLSGNLIDDTAITALDHVQGDLTIDTVTVDDNGPTMNIDGGTTDVPPNSTVTITITDGDGNTVVVTTTTDNNGNYDLPNIDISTLVDGPLTIEATTTDNNGDPVGDNATSTLDHTPGAITVEMPNVNDGNETQVPISGTTTDVAPGETVNLIITDQFGNDLPATATVNADGSYLVLVDLSTLKDGPLGVVATATDRNGGPVDATDTSIKDAVAGNITVQVDGVDDTTGTLDISGATVNVEEGEPVTLTITDQDGNVVTVTDPVLVQADGSYAITGVDVSSLTDGPLTIDASTVDLNGNTVDAQTTEVLDHVDGDLIIDNVIVDNAGPTVNIDGGTTDVPPGAEVVITITDQEGNTITVPGPVTVQPGGSYEVTGVDISTLVDGPLTVEASTTDNNGNPVSDNGIATLDHTPGAITVEMPNVNDGNETEVPVRGTTTDVAPGETVTLVITDQFNDDVTVTTTVNADGSYLVLVDLSTLADGTLSVDASATDRNGNTVTDDDDSIKDAVAGNITVEVDSVDNIAGTLNISGNTVNVEEGEAVTLTITDQDGNVVTVTDPVFVQADGSYSVTGVDVSTLVDGPLTVDASTVDLNGNTVQDEAVATLDYVPGELTLTIDDAGITETAGVITMPVNGTTEDVPENAIVNIVVTDQYGNTASGTGTVDINGDYTATIDISNLSDGLLTAVATTTDRNDEPLQDTDDTVLDERSGEITVTMDDADSANLTAVPINGTTTDIPEGATVTLLIKDQFGAMVYTTATVVNVNPVTGIGEYSTTADVSTLADGELEVEARAKDNNGVLRTDTDDSTKDSVDSEITVQMDDVTQANLTAVAITGATSDVQPGSTVTLTVTDGTNNVVVSATVQLDGSYSTTANLTSLADGTVTVTSTVVDQNNVTIDATDPSQKDATSPTLVISSVESDMADGETTTLTFQFSENVDGFDASDIQVTGGSLDTTTFTQISGSEWTIEFTADGSGPIAVSVDDAEYTDIVGNPGVGDSLPINNIPVGADAIDAAEDGDDYVYEAAPMFTDIEPGALTYTLDAAAIAAGFTIDSVTGRITSTLASDASQQGPASDGVYTITVTAADAAGATSSANLVLTVTNPVPVVTSDLPDVVVDDSSMLTIPTALAFNDPDGDDLEYTITVNGLDATHPDVLDTLGVISIDDTTGLVSVELDSSASHNVAGGEYVITVTVDDKQGGSIDTSFTLTATNPAPEVTPLPGETAEDGETVNIDTSVAFNDPDGDALTYSIIGLPAGLTFDTGTGVISGTLDKSASQGGVNGDGVYRITITVTDADGATATDILDLTVINPAPVFDQTELPNQTADDGAGVTFTTAQAFTDEDTLTFSATGLPEGLTINTTTGVISGTLLSNASQGGDAVDGVYTIVVTADDGEGGKTTGTFELKVENVNLVAVNDGDDTDQDTTIFFDPNKTVLANDDPDGDGDTFVVTQVSNGPDAYGPSAPIAGSNGGIFIINPDGTYQFDPNGDFDHLGAGQADITSVDYTIEDGQGGSDTATLTITVNGLNDDPEAEPDFAITGKDSLVNINVLANDTDIDTADNLTVTHVNGSAITQGTPLVITGGHTVVLKADGTLDFNPASGFDGPVNFDYTVSDGNGGTADASVTVNVISINIKDDASLSAPGTVDFTQGDNVLASIDDLQNTVFTGRVPVGGELVSVTVSGPGAPDIVLGPDDIWVLANGTFHLTANTVNVEGFDDGTLTITLVAQDAHGNQATTTDTILKDTITEVEIDPLLVVNGEVPTITGTGEPNSTITISIDGVVEGTTTVGVDGTWSFDNPVPGAVFEIQADAEDQWGNVNDDNGDPARDVREVPSLTLDIDQLTVLESGLPDGSNPEPNETNKTGSFSFNTDVDDMAHIVVHGAQITAQDLIDLETDPVANALAPITTVYGEIQITGFSSGSNTVTYEYRLTGNTEDHSSATPNDEVTEVIVIDVVDNNGDSRRDALEVVVVDDVPTAEDLGPRTVTEGVDPSSSTITGNVITDVENGGANADIVGADGARVHEIFYTDRDGDPATATVTATAQSPDGSVIVNTQYGELTIASDGSWTYVAVTSANHVIADGNDLDVADDFSYTLIDNDGDISNQATQPINVLDTVPEVDNPEDNVVREEHFPSGSHPNPDPDELTKTGSLGVIAGADTIVTTFDETQLLLDALIVGGLTSGGQAVTYSITDDDGDGNGYVLTATAGGNPVFTVTITDPTDAVAGYEFELHRPLDHHAGVNELPLDPADPNEPGRIDLKFNFTVTDSDGDQDVGVFTVTVVDDMRADDAQAVEVDEDDEITFITTADGTALNTSVHDAGSNSGGLKAPDYGTVTIESDGRITYEPLLNYSGTDTFEYLVDQNGQQTTVMVTVTVNPVADQPSLDGTLVGGDVTLTAVSTDEDTRVALNLHAPKVTDAVDENGTSPGDAPEKLGLITLTGLPSGAKLLANADGANAAVDFTATGGPITVFLTDDDQHIDGLTGQSLSMTKAQFEALELLPPPESHANISLTVEVTSYEVDDAGARAQVGGVDVPGATSTATLEITVQAVTDPIDLKLDNNGSWVDASSPAEAVSLPSLAEDTEINLKDYLQINLDATADGNTGPDIDGSEERWFTVTGVPAGWTINGVSVADTNPVRIDIPSNYNSTTPQMPDMIIAPAANFSGNLDGIKVTLNAQDRDSDGPDSRGVLLQDDVYLNLRVTPVADRPTAPDVETDEDTPVEFMKDLRLTDTDGSETITSIVVTLPTGWVIQDANGDDVSGSTVTIPPGDITSGDFRDYTVTPPAHSSVDGTLQLEVTVQDTETVGSGPVTDTETFVIPVDVTVNPVAERVGVDSDGDGIPDLTMNPDFDYATPGAEDEWFDLNSDGFDLKAGWNNQDTDEHTYARLTPELIAGDGNPTNAIGSQFQWTGSDGVVTYTGNPIDVPIAALDSLEFRAAPNFSGQFRIKVQAYTVDYDDDNEGSGTPAEALTGEAWLTNILIKPVADEVTLSVTGVSRGVEDTAIPLFIRPISSDPSETFEVIIDDIPNGATITYDGVVLTVASNSVMIADFDSSKLLTIEPPLDSNEDFQLKVSAVSVDILEIPGDPDSPYTSKSPASHELTIDVLVKGDPDIPDIELSAEGGSVFYPVAGGANVVYTVTEGEVDDSSVTDGNGNHMVALNNLILSVASGEVTGDGSETVRLHITGLPEEFDLIGASFLGGNTATTRAWLVSESQLANAKLVLPPNYSGTVQMQMSPVVTENDGRSTTFASQTLTLEVSPTPEAELQDSSSLEEDVLGAVDFSILHQNGDTDESLTSIRINKADVDAGDYTLYLSGVEFGAGLVQNIGSEDWYVLSGAQINNVTAKGHPNVSGDFTFDVMYQVTDPSQDGTLDAVSEWFNGEHTLSIAPVTDAATLIINSINAADPSDISVAGGPTTIEAHRNTDITVNLTLAKVPDTNANNEPDYDGSERIVGVIIDGVPAGVLVKDATYIGNIAGNDPTNPQHTGRWILDNAGQDLTADQPLSVVFELIGDNDQLDWESANITISVDTQDGAADIVPASQSWTLSLAYDFDDSDAATSVLPAEIVEWEDNPTFEATEDEPFSLAQAVQATISGSSDFAITITGFPTGTVITGMDSTTVGGQEVWTASGTGSDADLQTLLSGISVTLPPDWNNNNIGGARDPQFHATLTTQSVTDARESKDVVINQPVTPVTDETTLDVSAEPVDEGDSVEFEIAITNPQDGAAFSAVIDGALYIQIDGDPDMLGGTLHHGSTAVTLTSVTGKGPDIPDGDYYIIFGVSVDDTVTVTYDPPPHGSGNVTLDTWIQTQETGASNVATGHGTAETVVTAINSGYEFALGSGEDEVDGTERQPSTPVDVSLFIELPQTGGGLKDDDGSESVLGALLRDVPEDFLVVISDNADGSGWTYASNAGGGVWSIPTTGGELPPYIALLPPEYYNTAAGPETVTLVVMTKEQSLSEILETEQEYHVTVDPVANGITLNPTTSFGVEGSRIALNLNASALDAKETVNVTIKGLGAHAALYTEGTLIDFADYNYSAADGGTYTLNGLTLEQLDSLQFEQARGAMNPTLSVTAQTMDGTVASTEVTANAQTNVTQLLATNGPNTLLYVSGTGLNGHAGEDTVQLRYLQNLDSSDYGHLKNIEILDLGMAGANNVSNLSLNDVLGMTDANNKLTILGDSSDTVTLLDVTDAEWTLITDDTHPGNPNLEAGYKVYENAGNPGVILRIDDDININIIE